MLTLPRRWMVWTIQLVGGRARLIWSLILWFSAACRKSKALPTIPQNKRKDGLGPNPRWCSGPEAVLDLQDL